MRPSVLAAMAVACAAAAVSAAAEQAMPLTYAAFEPSVTHLDLEACPEAIVRDGVFCRLSIGGDMAHVWVFEEAGEQALVEVRSFGPDEYALTIR